MFSEKKVDNPSAKGSWGKLQQNETDGFNDSACGENAVNEQSITDEANLSILGQKLRMGFVMEAKGNSKSEYRNPPALIRSDGRGKQIRNFKYECFKQ